MLSVLTSTHMLQAARQPEVERYFYSSSACVYAADKQTDPDVTALKEADAYPAMPEDGYGWEKLFTERMCRHFERGLRPHHPRGPLPQRLRPARHLDRRSREGAGGGLPQGRRPLQLTGEHEIEIWGDGEQTRCFMYIDDCLQGSQMILEGDIQRPGQPRLRRAGLDQPARRHRRGDRRNQVRTPLRTRRASGRARPQQ